MTRHSNLSQVHMVFHLVVTDDKDVLSPSLRSRHSIIAGLKNCLRFATMHEVHNITIPLLLMHTMQPVRNTMKGKRICTLFFSFFLKIEFFSVSAKCSLMRYCTRTYTGTYMHTLTYAGIYIYTHAHACTHAHTHAHTHTHTHTYTHTQQSMTHTYC